MAKHTPLGQISPSSRSLEAIRLEEDRMREILSLIEQLIEREEITVSIILDCLYDVGTNNLISQRFRYLPLPWLMRRASWLSKPIFRAVALRWFKKNCPPLLTKWLRSKVQFEPRKPVGTRRPIPSQPATAQPAIAIAPSTLYNQEIQRLTSQVQVLTTLLIGVMTVTVGGAAIAWSAWQEQSKPVPALNSVQTISVDAKESALTNAPIKGCQSE